jgi:hypothetical protein
VAYARQAGLPAAIAATQYRNPLYFAESLVPLTYLPFDPARLIWDLLLASGVIYAGVLLARRFGLPRFWTVALVLTFPPVTLGLAWGNTACLLPLALLLLCRAVYDRTRLRDAVLFALIACVKAFPLVWLWIPLRLRRIRWLGCVALISAALCCASVLTAPGERPSLASSLFPNGSWLLDAKDVRLGQANAWSVAVQLTQGAAIHYHRHGASRDDAFPPPIPLSPSQTLAAALITTALAVIASGALAFFLLRRGRPGHALWLFATLLCLALPVTNYPYLAVALPAAAQSLSGRARRVRILALAGIGVLEIARFSEYLAAVAPFPGLVIQCGGIGLLVLAIALVLDGAAPSPGRARRICPRPEERR